MPEVVARGVLDQAIVAAQHIAGAGHHRQPGDPIAGEAVADHPDAAGVGGDVAANLAGAGRREIHRIEQPPLLGKGLQRAGHHARLAARQPLGRVEAENPVHAVEGHHHLALLRNRPAGQARAAAGGHQRKPFRVRQPHQGNHLVQGFGEDRCTRRRLVGRGPVAAPVRQIAGVPSDAVRREEGGQGLRHGVSLHAGVAAIQGASSRLPRSAMRIVRSATATWRRALWALR